jgi:hypothetical protein
MILLLGKVVDEFFSGDGLAVLVNGHAEFAFLGSEHHILAAHATDHIKRISGFPA